MDYVQADAVISGCERYRYALRRNWDSGGLERRIAVFWLCNPSTADTHRDDPTVRKCVGFARLWGCTGLVIGNIHAYRATNPRELLKARSQGVDVIGPQNEEYLRCMVDDDPTVLVAGWGRHGRWVQSDKTRLAGAMYGMGNRLRALALNRDGSPKHPLYVPYQRTLPLTIGMHRACASVK